jgi:hypothetical protein
MAKHARVDRNPWTRVLLFRSSAIAVTLAAAPLVLSGAFAAPASSTSAQAECEGSGYGWFEGRGCANKKCSAYGKTYEPGHTQIILSGPNKGKFYMCNGLTGRWELYVKRQPPTLKQNPNPVGSTQ